jgi:hypothetical protein
MNRDTNQLDECERLTRIHRASPIQQYQCETCGFVVTATTTPSMAVAITAHRRAMQHTLATDHAAARAARRHSIA